VAVFPFGPVVVEVVLTCAEAAKVNKVMNETVMARFR
jgi:hypothetical protein